MWSSTIQAPPCFFLGDGMLKCEDWPWRNQGRVPYEQASTYEHIFHCVGGDYDVYVTKLSK